jgi:hypothetical protein
VQSTANRARLEQSDVEKTEQTREPQGFSVRDSHFLQNEANHTPGIARCDGPTCRPSETNVTAHRNSTYPARSLLPER